MSSSSNNNNYQADVELKTRALNMLYTKAREKMKETAVGEPPNVSFTLTTEQALKEVIKEAKEQLKNGKVQVQEGLDRMIARENDTHNLSVPQHWKILVASSSQEDLLQLNKEVDESMASFLKRVRQSDPIFERFKQEHHAKDPERFDSILKELTQKGLMD